jgi:PPM family protein phosphatase
MEHNVRSEFSAETGEIAAYGMSDCGLERAENEDAIFIDTGGKFFLLADGMGGHERGAEASQSAIDIIRKYFDPEVIAAELADITDGCGVPPEISCIMSLVDDAVNEANIKIYERNQQAGLHRFMGTTAVGLILAGGGNVLWFHVGDSRLYRWRDSNLECMTLDHSAYVEWVRKGRKGEPPKKNIITRAIGPNPAVSPSSEWAAHRENDIYILCSDGLTDMITEDRIAEILNTESDVKVIADYFIEAAKDAGGKDNVSVIVCKVQTSDQT